MLFLLGLLQDYNLELMHLLGDIADHSHLHTNKARMRNVTDQVFLSKCALILSGERSEFLLQPSIIDN